MSAVPRTSSAEAAQAAPKLAPSMSLSQQSSETLEAIAAPVVVESSSPKASFKNWGQSFSSKPGRVFAPTSIEQCFAIVELARRNGVQLRPIGRAHSPSDLPFTKGWAMRMEGLKGVISIDHSAPTVTVYAGTYISDIHEALDRANPRLAMCNVGSISEQTLGGLISTATHGTGIQFPVVSSYVERLSILCPLPEGTQHLSCSRDKFPELFNASLCGLGTTGLITTITLRVGRAFNLKQYSEEVPFDTLFGPKTGFPVAQSSGKESAPIGNLVAQNRRLPPCRPEYMPSCLSSDPAQIHPAPAHANAAADKAAKLDPEDDEATRIAQQRLEEVIGSAQHVRLMWFPQAKMMTMLRANRSTEPESPAPSISNRIKASLINHRLTELLLYVSRFNKQLTPTMVRWIHYLTHPSSPKASEYASSPPVATPSEQVSEKTMSNAPANASASSGLAVQEVEKSLANAVTERALSSLQEEISWVLSIPDADLREQWWPGKEMPEDSPVPQPLSAGHAVSSVVGRSDRIFNMDCLFPQYTDEWAIPLSRAAAAIRAMRDWFEEEEANNNGERLHFPVEIRFADADGIWLSHGQGRKSCYIGLVQYRPYNQPVRYRQLFAKFEALMRHYAGRPHWAKAHTCSPSELATLYPHWNDFLLVREKCDPDRVFVNPYVERHLLGKVGEEVDSRVFKSRL